MSSVVLRLVPAVVILLVARFVAVRLLRHRSTPSGSFTCRVLVPGWPIRRCRAWWAQDVLVLRGGIVRTHWAALMVRCLEQEPRDARPREVRGMGRHPLVLALWCEDGTVVQVAARRRDLTKLVGPFLAAAIPGLAPGPGEQPRPRR